MQQIEDLGGSVKAIEAGFIQDEIEESAYQFQKDIESQKRIVVGVNRFNNQEKTSVPIQSIDRTLQERREQQVKTFRKTRNQSQTDVALAKLREVANSQENLFPYVLEAFRNQATLGEICGVLREVWGEYRG